MGAPLSFEFNHIILEKDFFPHVCECLACMYVYVLFVPGTQGSQKRVLCTLEPEL